MATTFPSQVIASPGTGTLASTPPVATAAAATAGLASDVAGPNYVAIYISTIFTMSMVFLLGVGVPSALFLDNYLAGFGLGVFCAAWGGPSFGVMAGGARVSTWFDTHQSDFSPIH